MRNSLIWKNDELIEVVELLIEFLKKARAEIQEKVILRRNGHCYCVYIDG